MEHGDDPYGEAIASPNHSAWANGTSSTLFDVLGRLAPISLLSAGIIRIEHMCCPADADHDFEFVPFPELAKTWSLPTSRKVVADWRSLVQDLSKVYDGVSTWWPRGDYRYSTRRPLSSRELWDGTQRILTDGTLSTGWPRGDTRQSRCGGAVSFAKSCASRELPAHGSARRNGRLLSDSRTGISASHLRGSVERRGAYGRGYIRHAYCHRVA